MVASQLKSMDIDDNASDVISEVSSVDDSDPDYDILNEKSTLSCDDKYRVAAVEVLEQLEEKYKAPAVLEKKFSF